MTGNTPACLSILILAFCFAVVPSTGLSDAEPSAANAKIYERIYGSYKPGFVDKERLPEAEEMRLSSETSFYTLNLLPESDRAYALLEAAEKAEAQGRHGKGLEIYQKVIDEYPDKLYRVSPYGIFVPVSRYCQLRILSFPPRFLSDYRIKHDARAAEAFALARENHSLEGLAQIRDSMLATSSGPAALIVLGDAALDRGHYLEALEYYRTVGTYFPDDDIQTPDLSLKEDYCSRMLGDKLRKRGAPKAASALSAETLRILRRLVDTAQPRVDASFVQRNSPPNVTADDYALLPATQDPLGLKSPVWQAGLPGSRLDFYVYFNPVVTGNSVIYRHKNIVYSRSILNGRLRWKNDLGGRVTWQNWGARQYTHEDVLVQDGLVFTTMHQVGPTLMALDEITGQLQWAYGPMAAGTQREANMRFEAAPAGGPRTVFAGYVLNNIEGATHTDTEYGVMAFESTTGRVRWQQHLCRLRPGLFSAGVRRYRNRIRSFASPPLYHEGTVYYVTNAGAVAALDALSGRVKWVMRYPYYTHPDRVHDATRQFGKGGGPEKYTQRFGAGGIKVSPHRPMFWYGQRPTLIGDDLYCLPIDSRFLYKLDRRTGKVEWTFGKPSGTSYFMGPIPGGELLLANSGRSGRTDDKGPIMLLDPKTGKVAARLEDPVAREVQPTVRLRYGIGGTRYPVSFGCLSHDGTNYQIPVRPFLGSNGQLIVGGFAYWGYNTFGYGANFAVYALDKPDRPVTARRRYFSSELVARTENARKGAAVWVEHVKALKHQSERTREEIETLQTIISDTPVQNEHPAFLPFGRITFERYGTLFELRYGPRSIAMVYDVASVKRALSDSQETESLFGAAEMAMREGRMNAGAERMQQCLDALPSEDQDFRTLINQQLYQAHKYLARASIRAGRSREEFAHCFGMNRTATSLSDEIETRFSVADAYERTADYRRAGRQLQSVAVRYSGHGYRVSSLAVRDRERTIAALGSILRQSGDYADGIPYTSVLKTAVDLLAKTRPLYFSTLSPLEKDMVVCADGWAARRLNRLRMQSKTYAEYLETTAREALSGRSPEEQTTHLLQFPGTRAAQETLEALLANADRQRVPDGQADDPAVAAKRRHTLWKLADMARMASLALPETFANRLLAPPAARLDPAFTPPFRDRLLDMEEERGTAWLVLERSGARNIRPGLLFLGGRVRKKIDNKFVLYCLDTAVGKVLWKAREKRVNVWNDEIRLAGKGDEPGFSEVFVHDDIVVTHGFFDVLAFGLEDGRLRWRYKVPFGFEIKHAIKSGDLLVLAGNSDTVALYLGTTDPRGEVAWQKREEGELYGTPYLHGDRLVSVRSMPFNVTTRYRSTGRLIGRLALPDLSLSRVHPLLKNGPQALPMAVDADRIVVTDEQYYLMLDVERMIVLWKRKVDALDETQIPAFRFELKGDDLAVLKRDYDVDAIYMLSSDTGEVRWHTDRKDRNTPQPIHSMSIRDGRLYGVRPRPGQRFDFVGLDCATGKALFEVEGQGGYAGDPEARLRTRFYGNSMLVEVRDRQVYELKAFDIRNGKCLHTIKVKGIGRFGEHGRVSATGQNGMMALMGKHKLVLSGNLK